MIEMIGAEDKTDMNDVYLQCVVQKQERAKGRQDKMYQSYFQNLNNHRN